MSTEETRVSVVLRVSPRGLTETVAVFTGADAQENAQGYASQIRQLTDLDDSEARFRVENLVPVHDGPRSPNVEETWITSVSLHTGKVLKEGRKQGASLWTSLSLTADSFPVGHSLTMIRGNPIGEELYPSEWYRVIKIRTHASRPNTARASQRVAQEHEALVGRVQRVFRRLADLGQPVFSAVSLDRLAEVEARVASENGGTK